MRFQGWLWIAIAVAAPSCKPESAATGEGKTAAAPATPCPAGEKHGALTWIPDDYAGALACAKGRGVPLVIDMWAPWCHSCISMQSFVLSDPSLAPLADRFVFAALDTDREVNAAALTKLPVSTWPTFFVVSPDDEAVQARFVGSATAKQWREFVLVGEHGALDARAKHGALDESSPLGLVRKGDRAAAAEDWSGADTAYQLALASGPADWPRRPEVLVAAIQAKSRLGDTKACLALAEANADRTGVSASATDFLGYALSCADDLAATLPDRVKAFRQAAVARLQKLAFDESGALTADDRSDAMGYLRGALISLGQEGEARALAEVHRAFIDRAIAEAPSPMAAMTYGGPAVDVYAYLGRHAELVPALKKLIEALPGEYDPPYRLAALFYKAGQHDEALRWAEKALSLVYGPRKARVQALVADIHKVRGDQEAERAARVKVVEIYKSLPPGHQQPRALAAAEKALAEMPSPPSKPTSATTKRPAP